MPRTNGALLYRYEVLITSVCVSSLFRSKLDLPSIRRCRRAASPLHSPRLPLLADSVLRDVRDVGECHGSQVGRPNQAEDRLAQAPAAFLMSLSQSDVVAAQAPRLCGHPSREVAIPNSTGIHNWWKQAQCSNFTPAHVQV